MMYSWCHCNRVQWVGMAHLLYSVLELALLCFPSRQGWLHWVGEQVQVCRLVY